MRKKVLALVLALVMVVAMLPTVAFAEKDESAESATTPLPGEVSGVITLANDTYYKVDQPIINQIKVPQGVKATLSILTATTITTDGSKSAIEIEQGGQLTIYAKRGLTITNDGENTKPLIDNKGTLTITNQFGTPNVTITSKGNTNAETVTCIDNSGTITIENKVVINNVGEDGKTAAEGIAVQNAEHATYTAAGVNVKSAGVALKNCGTANLTAGNYNGTVLTEYGENASSAPKTTLSGAVNVNAGEGKTAIEVKVDSGKQTEVNSALVEINTTGKIAGNITSDVTNEAKKKASIKIDNGTFTNGAENCVENFTVKNDLTVQDDGTLGEAIAQVGEKKFGTLKNAFLAVAENGGTVKLLKSFTLEQGFMVSSATGSEGTVKMTLDLNGQTITVAKGETLSVGGGFADLTITDNSNGDPGKIVSAESADEDGCVVLVRSGGTLTLEKGTIEATGEKMVAVNVGGSGGDSLSTFSVGKDATVTNATGYGIFVYRNGVLNVEGTVKAGGFAISGNGNGEYNGTAITIKEGAKVESTNSVAIYNPQVGTVTVEGGEITGKAGIVMRAGDLTVEGGKITATGKGEIENVGVTGRGVPASAIVADETEAYGAADTQPEVHISDGEFEAAEGEKTVVYTENSKEATEKAPLKQEPSIEVSNGTFKSGTEADTTVNEYVTQDVAVSTEEGENKGKIVKYENKILGFGYGATRKDAQDALKEIKDPSDPSALETATATWIDQTMFILFENPIPAHKVVKFTVTNGDFTYTDTCDGGEEGKSNLFAWSFLNQEQTPDVAAQPGDWTLTFEDGNINLNGKGTVSIPALADGEDVVHFATLTQGTEVGEEAMTVTTKTDENVGQYYEVKFDTQKLPQSMPSSGNSGKEYWLGWALEAPKNAAKMIVTKAANAADVVKNKGEQKNELEKSVVDGKNGYALYYKADNPGTSASWVRVTWQDGTGKPMGTTFIHVVFGNITFKPEDGKTLTVVGSGFNAKKEDAIADMNATYEKVTGGAGEWDGISDTADNTLWAAFKQEPADGPEAGVVYTNRVRKDGQSEALYTDSNSSSNKTYKGTLLYYSLDGQLSSANPKSGKYVIELLKDGLVVANAEIEIYEVLFVGDGVTLTPETSDPIYVATVAEADAVEKPTADVAVTWAKSVKDYTITYTATKYVAPSVSGGTATPSATVTTPASTNGSYTVSDKNAKAGDTVTITPKADEGYTVDAVVVTDKDGKDVTVTDNGDGTYSFVMPEKASQPVTVKVTFAKVAPSAKFVDVDQDAWYAEYVDYVVANGLMEGTSDTIFSPNMTTNRAMLVTILYRLEGEPAVTKDIPFSDVAAGEWYSDAINWAAANEIVNGYGDDTFRPLRELSREEAAAILYRYAEYKEYDVTATDDLADYTDAETVSTWADTAMSWAVAEGIIKGTSETKLTPDGTAVRAQAAAMLTRFCENVVK